MAAPADIPHEEVLRAGRVLFGPAFGARAPGWREALRATYRRRALETHPDRARALGRTEADLSREFHAVAEAYRVLSTLGGWPEAAQAPRPAPRAAAPPTARARRAATATAGAAPWRARPGHERVRAGASPDGLPGRRLRLAEYLYHAGYVPWSALAAAIAWQRAQRPPIGRIAVELGFLAPAAVAAVLERRRAAGAAEVRFGEFAVRQGFLTPFQLLASVGRQLRLQRRIGAFFVEHGMLDEDVIEEALRRLARHNARWR